MATGHGMLSSMLRTYLWEEGNSLTCGKKNKRRKKNTGNLNLSRVKIRATLHKFPWGTKLYLHIYKKIKKTFSMCEFVLCSQWGMLVLCRCRFTTVDCLSCLRKKYKYWHIVLSLDSYQPVLQISVSSPEGSEPPPRSCVESRSSTSYLGTSFSCEIIQDQHSWMR